MQNAMKILTEAFLLLLPNENDMFKFYASSRGKRSIEVYLIEGMKKSEGIYTGDLINNKIIFPTLLRTAQVSDVRSSALM